MDINEKINEHLPLVKYLVAKFRPKSAEERDRLIQAGRIGLWKAIELHDPAQGKLTTLAYRGIFWEIIRELKQTKPLGEEISIFFPFSENKNSTSEYTNLEKLSTKERLIFNMRLEGLTFREITYILEWKRGEVYQIYRKIVRKLNAKKA